MPRGRQGRQMDARLQPPAHKRCGGDAQRHDVASAARKPSNTCAGAALSFVGVRRRRQDRIERPRSGVENTRRYMYATQFLTDL